MHKAHNIGTPPHTQNNFRLKTTAKINSSAQISVRGLTSEPAQVEAFNEENMMSFQIKNCKTLKTEKDGKVYSKIDSST